MKQNPKGTYIEFSFLALVILGALVITGITTLNRYHKTSAKRAVSSIAPLRPGQIPGALGEKLMSSFLKLSKQKNYDLGLKIGYQFRGDNFQLLLPTSSNSLTFAYSKKTSESAAYDYFIGTLPTINYFLKQQGFGAPQDQTPSSSLLTKLYFYKRSDELCQVTAYTVLDINCTNWDSLSNSEQAANTFVKIYATVNPKQSGLAVSLPVVEKSQTPGWQIAGMNFYNSGAQTWANFYRKAGGTWQMVNKNWYETWANNHLTAGGNTMRDCGYFDYSPATAAAFKGQTCYDTYLGRQSIIK